jgi:hypothetical protein
MNNPIPANTKLQYEGKKEVVSQEIEGLFA